MENRNICKFNLNRSGDISCTDFVYETGNALGAEREAAQYMLCIVTEGHGELCQRDVCHDLHRGDLFFVLRGERFSISGEALSYCTVAFASLYACMLPSKSTSADGTLSIFLYCSIISRC